jgi:outer membrane receptor protein involved in Fe transport
MKVLSGAASTSSCLALAAALLMAPDPASAQEQPKAASVAASEEMIIVTAKGRAERIEQVPLSVVAVDSEFLRKQQIRDLRDLAGFVPSLVLEASRGRASPSTLAIRGLAPNTINKQLQSVSVFLDGVFLGGSASVIDFPDLAGVEVLRGPQATEFGRQTYAGAISYKTRERTPNGLEAVVDGFISFNQGAEEASRQISAGLYFPIVKDNLWGSIFVRNRRLGSLETITNAVRSIEVGREDTQSYSGTLQYKPHEDLSIRVLGMFQKQRDSAPAFTTQHVQEWEAQGIDLTTLSGSVLWPIGSLGAAEPSSAGCESAAGRPFTCGLDRDLTFVSLVSSYRFGDGYLLSLRGGYQTEKSWTNQDLYFRQSPDPFFGNLPYSRRATATTTAATKLANPFFSATSDDYSVKNAELRLTSPGDSAVRWKTGAFFYTESLTNFAVVNVRTDNPDGRSRGDEDVRNIAFFGDVAYDVAPRFTLQAEMRYDIERNTFQACLTCSTAATGSFNRNQLQQTSKQFLPRLTASWRPTDTSLIYLLYSEGTKPGRWNQTVRTNFRYVEPERDYNYELGFKARVFDNRVFISSAVFHMNVEDQQFAAVSTEGGVPVTVFQNIGSSKIDGFEIDTSFDITRNFRVRGGVGYAKHRYQSAIVPDDANLLLLFQGSTFEGKTSIGLPRWTGSVGADYDAKLAKDIDLRLGLNANYIGQRFADSANLAKLAGVIRVNLLANIDYKNLTLGLFVRDLFDNNKASSAAVSATNSCLYLNRVNGPRLSLNPEQRCLAVGIDRGREMGLNLTFRYN